MNKLRIWLAYIFMHIGYKLLWDSVASQKTEKGTKQKIGKFERKI